MSWFFKKYLSFHWHKGRKRGEKNEVYLKDDANPLSSTVFSSCMHNCHNMHQMLLLNELKWFDSPRKLCRHPLGNDTHFIPSSLEEL